jgi:protein-S-isoprenylcysteine O-methyltransferase Ste14
MYLGMVFVLGSIAAFYNPIGGIILIALFFVYITKFQIIPEERAMKDLFSDEFERYIKVTRRWF